MSLDSVVFVTQSANKAIEAERILRTDVERFAMDLPEIQAVNVREVIEHKAYFAYKALGGRKIIVEDTGLYIEAWNGLPGALVKWFVSTVGLEGICKMLHQFPDRRAVAQTIVALYDGQLHLFEGQIGGSIAALPLGEAGFGWDRIFIPEGATRTFGQMAPEEKDHYSMRRMAFESLAKS